jgi:hypothetical protein
MLPFSKKYFTPDDVSVPCVSSKSFEMFKKKRDNGLP